MAESAAAEPAGVAEREAGESGAGEKRALDAGIASAALARKVEAIGCVPVFSRLDVEERTMLADFVEELEAAEGEALFRTGDPGESMYIVCSGAVELATTDKLGQKILLHEAGPGELFGELSLLDQGPRSANATATQATRLLVLDRGALTRFVRARPEAALDMMAVMAARMRATDERLKQAGVRNANEVAASRMTLIERVTDAIAAFSGSFAFLVVHGLVFALWIGWNMLPGLAAFDPFPFGLLTMAVSLEAIFLAVIVLLSQNRQAAKDRIRTDIEYDVNLKAELEVSHLHDKIDALQAGLLKRLGKLERKFKQ
jgi:CRP/FNR family cyclic AMP-dependent transcriptional regulator